MRSERLLHATTNPPPEPTPARHGAADTPDVIAGRYTVLNQIGAGGTGAVFRAVDRLTGRVVTVKRLRIELGTGSTDSPALRTTLAHEFSLLAALRHPHVIAVIDYGLDDDRVPFLTMDLEENAQTIVEAGADQALAVQVDLLVQALRALVYVHRQNVIHRDIKPDNILVVRNQVKILDFGFSLHAAARAEDDTWAGTPAYMAPEVLLGGTPSVASDLYSFGLVAYEVLTGTHPFVGCSGSLLLSAIQETHLPRDHDVVDPKLRPILARLLARDPSRRYTRAGDVIVDLGQALGIALDIETVATRESFLQTAPLAGRTHELAVLDGALQDAFRGRGSTWLVGGESGVGKSRLLDEFRTRALVEGAIVLRGQAVSRGGSPYHPWRDIVTAVMLRTAPGDAEASVLATIVPNAAAVLGHPIEPAAATDAAADQSRLLLAVEHQFRVQTRPVVVILEDLHWAGSESLRLLSWLVQTAQQRPLLLLGSYRNDEMPDLPDAVPGAQLLEIPRLERAEIAALGTAMIGPAAQRAELLDLLERETEGIPFFVVEVVRTLAETSGALDRIGTSKLPERVISGGMQKVVRRRLGQVPAEALPALRSAAVTGREIDPALMRLLHPGLDVDDWAFACARAAILETRDQHWVFSHDKLREQLVDDLPPSSRRQLHQAIGEAMGRLYADRDDHLAALAYHWGDAGDAAAEAHYTREAGMMSLRTAACREAVRFLLRARELLLVGAGSDITSRRRRSGLLDPNRRIEVGSPEFLLGTVEAGLSEAFYRLGDLKTCREHSERALRYFGQHVPSSTAGWIGGTVREGMVRGAQAIGHVRARDPVSASRIAGEIARVQLRLTDTFFYSLHIGGILWSSIRVVNQCEPAGEPPELAQGYAILALLAGAARARPLADRWARRALGLAERGGIPRNVAWIRSRLAVYQVGECRWADCEAGVRHAAEVAERVGDLRLYEEARVQHACVAQYRARFDESLALFRAVRQASQRSGNRQIECWALMGEGTVLCRLGRDDEAVRLCTDALDAIDEKVMKAETISLLGALALAHLRLGDADSALQAAQRAMWHIADMRPVAYWTQSGIAGATEVLLSLLESSRGSGAAQAGSPLPRAREAVAGMRRFARHFPLGRPHGALWSGLAAWIDGRPRHAFRQWERALRLAEQLGTPYERARSHFEIGRHMPVGSPERLHHLRQAAEQFGRLGAARDAAAVTAVQRGAGTCP